MNDKNDPVGHDDRQLVILLAAYNGGKYIADQIRSIQRQTWADWKLVVRDDGSTDDTLYIVQKLMSDDKRIQLICKTASGANSAKSNFVALMEKAKEDNAAYVMFSDQDDIWRKDKVELQMLHMEKMKRIHGKVPICIHSDMQVVDESCEMISKSFMRYQGIRHLDRDQLNVLLVQNFVTGCTMFFNRALLDVSLPVPDEADMHDWWLAQVSSALGVLSYIDEPLVMYRQHSANVIGAKRYYDTINPFINSLALNRLRVIQNIEKSTRQARLLANRLLILETEFDMTSADKEMCLAYADFSKHSRVGKIILLLRYGIRRISRIESLILLFAVFLYSPGRKA
jgi:glycosyltransferase involved in cell wall biosynthesis